MHTLAYNSLQTIVGRFAAALKNFEYAFSSSLCILLSSLKVI